MIFESSFENHKGKKNVSLSGSHFKQKNYNTSPTDSVLPARSNEFIYIAPHPLIIAIVFNYSNVSYASKSELRSSTSAAPKFRYFKQWNNWNSYDVTFKINYNHTVLKYNFSNQVGKFKHYIFNKVKLMLRQRWSKHWPKACPGKFITQSEEADSNPCWIKTTCWFATFFPPLPWGILWTDKR